MVEHDNDNGPCACGAWHKPEKEMLTFKKYTVWITVRIPVPVVATSEDDAREKVSIQSSAFLAANSWIDKVEVKPKLVDCCEVGSCGNLNGELNPKSR